MTDEHIVKCRICGRLMKRPSPDWTVYRQYDPSCCGECNREADKESHPDKWEQYQVNTSNDKQGLYKSP